MSVLLIDFEATGVEPTRDRIIEIGAMVVDDSFEYVSDTISTLVWESGYPALTDEVKEVTGITQEMLLEKGRPLKDALSELGALVNGNVSYAIAYNRSYDETLFKEELYRSGLLDVGLARLATIPWLCAMIDIETNYRFKSWRLAHMALEYRVPVDPTKLHRALDDVGLMRLMLHASKTTPAEMYAFQQVPWVYAAAITRPPWEDKGVSTDAARARGYNWQRAKGDPSGATFEKRWVKRIKEKDFDKEVKEAPFVVRLIKEES